MALSLLHAPVSFAGAAAPAPTRTGAPKMESVTELKALAKQLNPAIGYWNPLQIGENQAFADENGILPFTDDEFIAWFRHAEIKHGRVAMAAFVGFTVQSLGVCFPWAISGTQTFADIAAAGGPGAQWDALSLTAKAQIFTFIFLMEVRRRSAFAFLLFQFNSRLFADRFSLSLPPYFYSQCVGESDYALGKSGQKHYMRGGKPGFFPSIKEDIFPHPVPLDLFDPAGFTKKLTEEQKQTKLLAEINNGRLAMIGIMGLCSASKGLIVPGLDSLGIAPYGGMYMAPFEGQF